MIIIKGPLAPGKFRQDFTVFETFFIWKFQCEGAICDFESPETFNQFDIFLPGALLNKRRRV